MTGRRFGLDKICCLECFVGTILCNSAKCLSRYIHDDRLVNLRYEDPLLLKIWLATYFAPWIKLRRTSAVTVLAPDLGLLTCDVALLCHKVVV